MQKLWLVYSFAAILGWGIWGFLVKEVERSLSPWATFIVGSAGAFMVPLLLLVFAPHLRAGWQSKAGLLALLAGVIGNLAVILFFLALHQGSASIVVPLTAIYPLITVLLGYLILGERLTSTQWTGVLLAVIAAFLLSR